MLVHQLCILVLIPSDSGLLSNLEQAKGHRIIEVLIPSDSGLLSNGSCFFFLPILGVLIPSDSGLLSNRKHSSHYVITLSLNPFRFRATFKLNRQTLLDLLTTS